MHASVAGLACALLASGSAALVTQAGFGRHASALWLSALTLATMMSVPLLMSRATGARTTLATALALIVSLSAMSAVPAYLNGLAHDTLFALLISMTGAGCLFYRLRFAQAADRPNRHASHAANRFADARRMNGSTALLALLAGLSSGTLARFQLFAICGMGDAQPFWQIALSLSVVCALAGIADRSRGNSTLIAMYLIRAALIGTLALTDNPALAPLAAKIFLILDCLTIPALLNLRGNTTRVIDASCPGIAHHIGMVLGATLSSSSYFFGDGFIVLYTLSTAANLICAASLANRRRTKNTGQRRPILVRRPTTRSA